MFFYQLNDSLQVKRKQNFTILPLTPVFFSLLLHSLKSKKTNKNQNSLVYKQRTNICLEEEHNINVIFWYGLQFS